MTDKPVADVEEQIPVKEDAYKAVVGETCSPQDHYFRFTFSIDPDLF